MSKKTANIITLALLVTLLFSINAYAVETPSITVGSATGKPGETVSIPISIANNSGIIAFYCNIGYDDLELKLTKVTNGTVLTDPAHSGSLTMNPYRLCFDMSLASENNTKNGVVATLDFEILSTATSGNKTIIVDYNPNEIYNYNLNNVYFNKIKGEIAIVSGNNNPTQSDNSPPPPTQIDPPNDNSGQNNTPESNPQNTPPSSVGHDDVVEIPINPNGKIKWDKIIIDNTVIQEKNITTEQTDEGVIIRGDDLSDIKVEVQKGDKTVSVEINTERNEVLLKENENGKIGASVDENGDGVFETYLFEPQPFEDITENNDDESFPLIWKILMPIFIIIVGCGITIFIIQRRRIMKK